MESAGASAPIPLSIGENKIKIKVTAGNGDYKFHTLTVIRSDSSGNGNNGNGSGEGNSGQIDPVAWTKTIEDDTIIMSSNKDENRAELSILVAEIVKHKGLRVEMPNLTLDLPTDLIGSRRGSAQQWMNGSLEINISELEEFEAQKLLNRAMVSQYAQLKPFGPLFEIDIKLVANDGAEKTINQPVILRFPVDPSIRPQASGIYRIDMDGTLGFIGGKLEGGQWVAEVQHQGQYGVLSLHKTFADVPSGHWASGAIERLAAMLIVNGTSKETLDPDKWTTRAEFIAMLMRALKIEAEGELTFTDIRPGSWYEEAIASAVGAGIVTGKSDSIFDPNGRMTREEMVTVMMRAYRVLKGTDLNETEASAFNDEAAVASWGLNAVRAAASLQIIQGRTPSLFAPKETATRAEAVIMLTRIMNEMD